VVGYVFAIAVLNFGLGVALGAWRDRRRLRRLAPAEVEPADRAVSELPASAPPAPPAPTLDFKLSREEEEEPEEEPGFASPEPPQPEVEPQRAGLLDEVLGRVLSLDIHGQRRRLVALQQRAAEGADAAVMGRLKEEFQALNQAWLASAAPAWDFVQTHREELDGAGPAARGLAEALARITRQAEQVSQSLAAMGETDNPADACRRLHDDAKELLDDLQILRDERWDVQLAALPTAGALESLRPDQLSDPLTGLHNRLGLEAVHREWGKEGGNREWSIAVLDIDGFGYLNSRLGPAVGDRILTAFGGLADDLLRKDRGFDRAGRGRGDSFVLFLGETDIDHAVNAVERIRQTIDASSFALGQDEIDLTVSIGVAPGDPHQSLAAVLERALEAARAAKEQGGNRTFRYTEAGPQKEPSRAYQVKGRVVKLDTAATP
jgi:diguanylate cyclase (GGDEF)-like protein